MFKNNKSSYLPTLFVKFFSSLFSSCRQVGCLLFCPKRPNLKYSSQMGCGKSKSKAFHSGGSTNRGENSGILIIQMSIPPQHQPHPLQHVLWQHHCLSLLPLESGQEWGAFFWLEYKNGYIPIKGEKKGVTFN